MLRRPLPVVRVQPNAGSARGAEWGGPGDVRGRETGGRRWTLSGRGARVRAPGARRRAFGRQRVEIARVPEGEPRVLAGYGGLEELPGVGDTTAAVIAEALAEFRQAGQERKQDIESVRA